MSSSPSTIHSADFVVSNVRAEDCPAPDRPEFAFIGRSNVGKSSLINSLTNRKDLAKTSGRPGKTQLINHFLINGTWYLVDLPGYGYARVSKDARKKFSGMIRHYVSSRPNLINLFVLIDSRLEPQNADVEFMRFLGVSGVPFSMVFTKTDKINANQLQKNLAAYNREMHKSWSELPQQFITSAVNGKGRDELLEFISTWVERSADEIRTAYTEGKGSTSTAN